MLVLMSLVAGSPRMLRMVPLLVLLLAALPVRHAGYVLIPSDAPSKTPEQVQKAIDNWSTSISSEPAQTQVPPLYQAIFDSHNRYSGWRLQPETSLEPSTRSIIC
jgi:hypothetical protein